MGLARTLARLVFGKRLPRTSGTLTVTGAKARIVIHRDRLGIPIIEAQNDADAWFGLGFCHGQDRTFQLETLLRLIRGTLAERIGSVGVPIDRLLRRLGLKASAEKQWPCLAPTIQANLTAYANGINEGGTVGRRRRPFDFLFIGGRPTPWSGSDILGFVKLQSFLLASNWDSELIRLQAVMTDGPSTLAALDPTVSLDVPGSPLPRDGLARLAADIALLREFVPTPGGSNNWVIAGTRTATGRPILACDPHLAPTLPAPWYLAHLRTADWQLVGAGNVGSPAITVGHNGHVAWGLTAGLGDNTDLFLEEVNADGTHYRSGSQMKAGTIRREEILVHTARPVIEEVLETERGPIITPALNEPGIFPALSLRATWLDAVPVNGFLGLTRVRTVREFREVWRDWPFLSVNLVAADTAGSIAYQFAGTMPQRDRGNGTIPIPGAPRPHQWADTPQPFDDLPAVENPPEGFLATANSLPPCPGKAYLGVDCLDGWRAESIRRRLAERTGWTLADCAALHLDVLAGPWPALRDILRSLKIVPEPSFLADLLQWDGRLVPESREALIYQLFMAQMTVAIAVAKAPQSSAWFLGRTATTPGSNTLCERLTSRLIDLLRRQPDGWFVQGWPTVVASVLHAVGDQLTMIEPERRTWGAFRRVTLRHPLFGTTFVGKQFFNHVLPGFGGDSTTIQQASTRPLALDQNPDSFPGLRVVMDVGNWSASRFAIAGGQSENPFSPNHIDQVPGWLKAEGVPIPWTPEEITTATRATLTLETELGA